MADSLPLLSLNHISRVVKDVQASIDFYTRVLGFIEIKRPSSFHFEGAWLFNYGIGIHLIEGTPEPRSKELKAEADHLSFQSDCLPAVEERLRTMGVRFIKTQVEEAGMRVTQVCEAAPMVFMHTPDYETIEICNCDCLPVVPLSGGLCGKALSKEDLGGCRPRVDLASPAAAQQLHVQQKTAG